MKYLYATFRSRKCNTKEESPSRIKRLPELDPGYAPEAHRCTLKARNRQRQLHQS